jgi:hypothetical protein
MEYPVAELIDRYSILLLKKERLPNNPVIQVDLLRHAEGIFWIKYDSTMVQSWVDSLKDINGLIWDLEADIRAGREGEMSLEEVGRRAIKLRDLNAERVRRKNNIAAIVGDPSEIKVDHASAL